MNVLWLPHNSWSEGRFQRDQYLVAQLQRRHRFVILRWESYLPHTLSHLIRPQTYLKTLGWRESDHPLGTICQVPRVPELPWLSRQLSRRGLSINTPLLTQVIKSLRRRFGIDVVVFAGCGLPLGLPPKHLGIPLVYDYVDWFSGKGVSERECVSRSTAVVCVSEVLAERARCWNPNTFVIPNGAELEKFRRAQGERLRERLGLRDNKVVSLIGLTASPTNYFLRAIQIVKEQEPRVKCLLVGKSESIARAIREADPSGDTFLCVGPVPYDDIPEFFAASDVGLYPGDHTDFFKYASPIKVFEYFAAGKPVVSSQVLQFTTGEWPNLLVCEPTAESFAVGILHSLRKNSTVAWPKSLNAFDWSALADQFEEILIRSAGT